MNKPRIASEDAGFTIVELMIATAILSTIILLATVIMISIGSLYSKGINQSRVQDDVRTITDQISQDLKLNSNGITPNNSSSIKAYCIGTSVRYSYVLGRKLGAAGTNDTDGTTHNTPHVLWRDNGSDTADTVVGSTGCKPIDVTKTDLSGDTSGVEMIAPNSRLTDFTVNGPSPYSLSVAVAYGDIDLLNLNGPNTTCKGTTGEQFCATASLHTTIVERVTN